MAKPAARQNGVIRLALLLGLGAGLSGIAPVAAQALKPTIADCAVIARDGERLACYDRLSGHVAGAPAQSRAAATRTAAAAPGALLTTPTVPAKTATTLDPAPLSLIDTAWGFNPNSDRFSIALYRPNYVQVARYSDRPNNVPFQALFNSARTPNAQLDPTEARFQLSFKARLWATDNRRFGVWVAYTQQSQWQVYNSALSRPFRENNYEPEVLLSYRPNVEFGGFNWRLLNIGYNHQSNGRANPVSRSWNRIVAQFGIERGNFALLIRPWYRIPESGGRDDNPDILDYYGYGDLTAIYKWRDHSFQLMARGNPNTSKGAAQFSWTTPPLLGPLRGYVQAFTGYGDSLIDYNWKQNAIGIGVTLNDLL
ncbi:phospholipase A [uncultured Thiodictyon sp.]|uniref:phospholipase A n=1 Tax=uncultured Thiodictyon sp. TaxID=1846217 RepID=UPI0025CDCD00|nr:phospholipase A [uncultured Thiodictyon sp.]